MTLEKFDVIIIGAGAAGFMCAIEAAKRGRKVLVIDHANKPGKKILMSGGGRCNFTNLHISADKYISHNPHFCKSALSRFTQWDFIDLVKKYHIPFHEKTLGQLFCDEKSKAIVELLLAECSLYDVKIQLNMSVHNIQQKGPCHFVCATEHHHFECESLVIASGGLSIPTMGASPLGYKVAEQFGIKVWPTRAGLVPLTLHEHDKKIWSELSGVSLNSMISAQDISFHEDMLFTHRGLSGPAILQISSYWQPGQPIEINLSPNTDMIKDFKNIRETEPHKLLKTILTHYFPKRFIESYFEEEILNRKISSLSMQEIQLLIQKIHHWEIKPNGTEGYRTAEVTLGGVDCDALSSKTMECLNVKGLYFIGEVVDVTGWLGGYNFQWAWSSGWAAGQVV